MNFLEANEMVQDRFKIHGSQYKSGGQSCWYKAIDTRDKSLDHVFLKQYSDLNIYKMGHLHNFYKKVNDRIGVHKNRFCLPLNSHSSSVDYEPIIDIAGGAICLVFPWIEGITLDEFLLNEMIKEKEKIRIIISFINALRIIHENGIIHLDLKPQNIMVQKHREELFLRIIDMDLAQVSSSPDYMYDFTGIRKVGGTPFYSSPEHLPPNVDKVSPKSDIFAFGIISSMVLQRYHPFSESSQQYNDAILKGDFNVPNKNYHPDIISVIEKSLDPLQNNRPDIKKISRIFHRLFSLNFRYIRAMVVISDHKYTHKYFETTIIGKQQLKAFKVGKIYSKIFILTIDSKNGYYEIELRNDLTSIELNGKNLAVGKSKTLGFVNEISINGHKLSICLEEY